MLKAMSIPPTSKNGSFGVANAHHAGATEFLGEGSFDRVFRLKHRGEDVAIKFPNHHNDMLTEVAAFASVPPPPTRASCSSLTCTAWGTRWG